LKNEQLALYTTVYPGVEKYFRDWYRSVKNQTDNNFDIWVGVDGISMETIKEAAGEDFEATWVFAEQGDSPARIRSRSISRIVNQYPGVVFTDSDDILQPERIALTRNLLEEYEVAACAMRLVDKNRRDLGLVFFMPTDFSIQDQISKVNLFGLTNSAFRSETLSKCLPIPDDCVLVDWYLASLAIAGGAKVVFSNKIMMDYRQHENNIGRILPPFSGPDVIKATKMVMNHYECLNRRLPEIDTSFSKTIAFAEEHIRLFYKSIDNNQESIRSYLQELNQIPGPFLWWEWVNHPALEKAWKEH